MVRTRKNKKFTVVIFYGPYAVGKYTVAKEFSHQTGFKFFHNHHTADPAVELFERSTLPCARLVERLRFVILEEIAKAGINAVGTHAYSANFVSKTGLSDPAFVKKLQSIVEKQGGTIYFIHLTADLAVLLKRVLGESRKKFHKIQNLKVMKEALEKVTDWETPAPVRNNFEINNTKLSPNQVVKIVRKLVNA